MAALAAAGAGVEFAVNDDGWPLSPAGYELNLEVGQGAFARVIKAFCPSKDSYVAIKIMSLENISTSLEEIQAEVKAMKSARHPNILDLYCCFVVKNELWLVMPLMDKGSCYYVMRMLKRAGRIADGQGLPEEAIAVIMRELLAGLDYIHEHGQIHRDIKAGNILINSDGRIAIADFGVSGWMSETGEKSVEVKRSTFVGTPCWMAPEVMEQSRGYNEKADIWSVGITALELFKGYAPYARLSPMQVLVKTIREPPPSFKSYAEPVPVPSDRFAKFVERCLNKDPRLRPSARELLTDPFVKRSGKTSLLAGGLLASIVEVGAGEGPKAADAAEFGYAMTSLPATGASVVPGTSWVFPETSEAPAASLQLESFLEGIDGLGGETGAAASHT